MGAIRVEIPVGQVAKLAAAGRNNTLAALAGIFTLGFGLLLGMMYQTIIKPVERSIHEVEGFTEKIDSVVGCSKELVQTADQQAAACRQAQAVVDAGQVAETSRSLRSLADSCDKNAMQAEESAMYCNQLEDAFLGLKSRLRKMLGKS